jgi:hypothetical protein
MSERIWNVDSTYSYEDFEPALNKLVSFVDTLQPEEFRC